MLTPVRIVVAIALAAAVSLGAPGEKERLMFRARSADTYAAKDAHEGLIAAAEPFDHKDKTKDVFGKMDPLKAGFLPVLVVITNTTDKAVRLDDMVVRLQETRGRSIEPIPPEDVVLRLRGKQRPREPLPSPLPRWPGGRNSNAGIEVQAHAFENRMLPPNATASGFFYFQTARRGDRLTESSVLLNKLFWAHDQQELMFYEIPLKSAVGKN